MGAADVVPGVSGGTVALVTGIYPRLVASISAGSKAAGLFVRFDFKGGRSALRIVDWPFLLSLVSGAAVAVIAIASLIEALLHDHPIRTAGVFFGLIVGTIVIAWRMLKAPSMQRALMAVAVGLVAF